MKLTMKYAIVSFDVLLIILIYIVYMYCPFNKIKDQGFKINIAMGPGDHGTRIVINPDQLSYDERILYKSLREKYGFNAFVSDLISPHRTPGILLHEQCRQLTYTVSDQVSVIIAFKNEYWSVLLRTIHSILNRTPPHLLSEIILVDDASDDESLKGKLDIYVSYLRKVRIVRRKKSTGLMIAKQHGIDQSHTDIIVVMDSHHEVANVWLEPLIDHLKKNPRALVVPDVGIISREDFHIHMKDFNKTNFDVFTFDFNLDQYILPLKREYLESREKFWASPIRIPSIIGNMFAANKTFFNELGGFDTGMEIWGAEQMELSIKYILCGAGIYALPCSKVAHLYRVLPWHLNEKNVSNEYRVAEVWLDEYKNIFLRQKGDGKLLKTGDVAARKRIREVNNCRPFEYYIKIANALIDGYYIPGDSRVRGMIRPMNAPDVCLDNGDTGGLYRCHSQGGNQYWELTKDYELRRNYVCVVKRAKFENCSPKKRVQWDYLKDNRIQLKGSDSCLSVANNNTKVELKLCSRSVKQLWIWKR